MSWLVNAVFLISILGFPLQAAVINQTAVKICAVSFTNCTNQSSNCTGTFYDCMKGVEVVTQRPKSCYQADAAETCFRTAVQVSAAIFAASILAAVMPTLINWIQSAKCWDGCCVDGCCSNCGAPIVHEPVERLAGEDPANPDKDNFKLNIVSTEASKALSNLDYLKKVSTVTFGQIAAYFSIAISFASAGQLFNLWQAWTVAVANCEYDSYQ